MAAGREDRVGNLAAGMPMSGDRSRKVVELDLRGLICPATLLQSLREINRLRPELVAGAARLEILTNNRDSTATVSGAANSMGYKVEVRRRDTYDLVSVEEDPWE
jgi:TusA-related sulfurtransferase